MFKYPIRFIIDSLTNYFKHCLYCFCLSQKTALVMENARVSDGKPDIFLLSQYQEIQNILGMRNFAKLC